MTSAILFIAIGFLLVPACLCIAACLYVFPELFWDLYKFAWCMLIMAPLFEVEG